VQGRPRKITHEAEEGIVDFIDQNPTAYQDEVAEFLLTEYGTQAPRVKQVESFSQKDEGS
jgi:hypothetical protein